MNEQIGEEIARFFKPRSYGEAIQEVVIVLVCRDPMYRFKQRVRLDRKERIFYTDVMLDWGEMLGAGPRRRAVVLGATRRALREVLERRHKRERLKEFDLGQFLLDFDTVCARLARA